MKRPTLILLLILAINAAIIIATERSGEGFYEHGVIHGVAVLFIVLAMSRIPVLWRPYKEPAGRFVRWLLFALLVFAGSHVLEYLGFRIGGEYTDAMFANVGNAYIISLLAIIVGLEHILRSHYMRSKLLLRVPIIGLAAAGALLVVFLLRGEGVSLEPDAFLPYLYTIIVLGLGIFGFVNLLEVKRLQPKLEEFARHMSIVLLLVVLAALINVLYELVEEFLHIEEAQLIYYAHYAFYAGVSVLYLAFGEPVRALAEESGT